MTTVPSGFGDQETRLPGHIGLLYESHAERRARELDFLGVALADPQQGVAVFGAPGVAAQVKRDLERGLERSLDGEVRRGKVVLIESDTDPDVCLERFRDTLDVLTARGYAMTRLFARCAWNAPGFPSPEDQLWLEWRCHAIIESRQAIFVCAYDLTALPGSTIVYGGLETHPQMVLAGQLIDNPSFVESDRYFADRLLRLPWLLRS